MTQNKDQFGGSDLKAKFTITDVSSPNLNEKKELVVDMGNHLTAHSRRNLNTKHINKSIYHLLLNPFTMDNAYSNISKNKGSLTAGVDGETIQSYSRSESLRIVSLLRSKDYVPQPVRREYIPKPGKKEKRPLGIPAIRDRVVQEALRGILEAVYEPEFREFYGNNPRVANFGFRPNVGCWDAIQHYTRFGQTCTFAIEGDIKGAYNNVNHKKLIQILKKRITDKFFLTLISKFLKAGIMDEGRYVHSLIGVPQGGIVSPILFNIYMFEFDKYVKSLIDEHNQDFRTNKTKEYQKILYQKNRIHGRLKQLYGYRNVRRSRASQEQRQSLTLLKEFNLKLFRTPSREQSIKLVYTRYADDWVLGVGGPYGLAMSIKDQLTNWLKHELLLELSSEKTKITNIREGLVNFLGYSITLRSSSYFHKISWVLIGGRRQLRRVTSGKFYVKPHHERVIAKLKTLGITKGDNLFPIGKRAWAALDEFQIVQKYRSMFQGLVNHYSLCNSTYPLNRLNYIYKYSCAKTLAVRRKITMSQVFGLYGKTLKIDRKIIGKDNAVKIRTVEFPNLSEFRIRANPAGLPLGWDPFKIRTFWRTTFKLYSVCCVCGSDRNIEMHHVKSLKSIKTLTKNNKTTFDLILKQLNRKQIPVCHDCHVRITSGRYSGKGLTDLFNESLAAL